MGFLGKLFSKDKNQEAVSVQKESFTANDTPAIPDISDYSHMFNTKQESFAPDVEEPVSSVDFTRSVDIEEKEEVSVVAAALLAGDRSDVKIQITQVVGIDTDRQIAAVISAAIAAGTNPDTAFRLKSITEC